MEKKKFQKLAVRTESIVDEINISVSDGAAFISALQSYAAITEVLDAYKKHIFYKKPLDRAQVYNALRLSQDYADLAEMHSETQGTEDEQILDGTLDMDPRIFHALLGTITEHGEIAEAMIKALLGKEELDLVNVCEELGDSDWYKALFYEATGIDWDDAQKMIISKLEIRYADKIFSAGEAEERDLPAERALLESSVKDAVDKFNSENNE